VILKSVIYINDFYEALDIDKYFKKCSNIN